MQQQTNKVRGTSHIVHSSPEFRLGRASSWSCHRLDASLLRIRTRRDCEQFGETELATGTADVPARSGGCTRMAVQSERCDLRDQDPGTQFSHTTLNNGPT